MGIFLKLCLFAILILKPLDSHSNNEKKLTIAHLIQSAEITLKKLNKNTETKTIKIIKIPTILVLLIKILRVSL